MVIIVLIAVIIVIVCLKHTKIKKTMDKSNVINPQTTYYMSVLYIIDELSIMTQVTVNKTSPVSDEVIEE